MVAGSAVGQGSAVRAALVVAAATVLGAVLTPYLTFGWVSPKFTFIGVVFAAATLLELQGILLGFFGGVLLDALGGGLFGVGALSGLAAGLLAGRSEAVRPRTVNKLLLAQVVAVSVVIYDLVHLTARGLAGFDIPPPGIYALTGVLPDALVNAILAYLVGGWLIRIVGGGEEE